MEKTTKDETSFHRGITRFLKVGAVLHVLVFLALSTIRIAFPYNICYDAFSWIPAQHLLEGKNPFSYAVVEPYSMNPYGIAYYILFAVGVKFFGYQLWWGKFLSVAAFAVCLRLAVAIARTLGVSEKGVLMVVCAGLAMYPAQVMFGCSRAADIIGTAFALAAVLLVLRDSKSELRNLIFLALTVSAAHFTKQTFILPFFIVILRYTQLRKGREILLFTLLCFILIGGGTVFLNSTSNGGYFWQHYTYAKTLPYAFSDLLLHTLTAVTSPAFLFAAVFLGLYLFSYRKKIFQRNFPAAPEFLLLTYFVISVVIAAITSGRIGGDVNYFIEGSCLLAIYCGIVFDKWIAEDVRENAAAMVFLLLVGNAYQYARFARSELVRYQSRIYYNEISETARKYITPQSVCVSVYPELVVWNGCRFDFDDFTNYSVGWSLDLRRIFEEQIRSGKYDVLVWDSEDLTREFPGYTIVPMKNAVPGYSMEIFLYVRNDLLTASPENSK